MHERTQYRFKRTHVIIQDSLIGIINPHASVSACDTVCIICILSFCRQGREKLSEPYQTARGSAPEQLRGQSLVNTGTSESTWYQVNLYMQLGTYRKNLLCYMCISLTSKIIINCSPLSRIHPIPQFQSSNIQMYMTPPEDSNCNCSQCHQFIMRT